MQIFQRALLIGAGAFCLTNSAAAQQPDDHTDVVRVALLALKEELPHGKVIVDAQNQQEDPIILKTLATLVDGRAGHAFDFVKCERVSGRTRRCSLEGADVVVMFGTPTFNEAGAVVGLTWWSKEASGIAAQRFADVLVQRVNGRWKTATFLVRGMT